MLRSVIDISKLANIYFVRQKETKGLGHAVNCARSFVGNEPFAVLYGDDVIIGDDPACGQLIRAYEEFGQGVLGVKQVSPEAIVKYSSLQVEPIRDNLYHCTNMVEKPSRIKFFLCFLSWAGVSFPRRFSIPRPYPAGGWWRNPVNRRYVSIGPYRRNGGCRFYR